MIGGLGGAGLNAIKGTGPVVQWGLGTVLDTGIDTEMNALNGDPTTWKSIGSSLLINGLFNGVGVAVSPKSKGNISPDAGLSDQQIADKFVEGLEIYGGNHKTMEQKYLKKMVITKMR